MWLEDGEIVSWLLETEQLTTTLNACDHLLDLTLTSVIQEFSYIPVLMQ